MDNQNSLSENPMRTCGICNIICSTQQEVNGHACMDGYNGIFVDDNFYFYPLLDDGVTIIRRSAVGISEPIVAEELPRRPMRDFAEMNIPQNPALKKHKKIPSYDDDELLINEVKNRPPLWDFTLPLEQRGSKITPALWKGVSVALNGKLTALQAKAKFKNLNDTYRRIVQAEDLPSGSATKVKAKKWAHYDSMEFLRDSCLKKSTISNFNDIENVNINDEDHNNDTNDPGGDESLEHTDTNPAVAGKRKKKQNQPSPAANAIERIADAICQPSREISLPPMPQRDEVDGCLTMLGSRLRKMSSSIQLLTMQKLLNVTYEALLDDGDAAACAI